MWGAGRVVSGKTALECPPNCDAQVTYSEELVFAQMMDDELSPTVAFMLGVFGAVY